MEIVFLWTEYLWECISFPARALHSLLNFLLVPLLGDLGGVTLFNAYFVSFSSIVVDIAYIIVNLIIIVLAVWLYRNICPQKTIKPFIKGNLLMAFGTLMPFVAIGVYRYMDTTATGIPIKTENVLKIAIPVALVIVSIVIVGYWFANSIKGKSVGVFFLMLAISFVSQGTVLILFPWVVCLMLLVVYGVFLVIIAGIFLCPFIITGSTTGPTSTDPPPTDPYIDYEGSAVDNEGIPYMVINDNWVRNESTMQGVRVHRGRDGYLYMEKGVWGSMDHSDNRLYKRFIY